MSKQNAGTKSPQTALKSPFGEQAKPIIRNGQSVMQNFAESIAGSRSEKEVGVLRDLLDAYGCPYNPGDASQSQDIALWIDESGYDIKRIERDVKYTVGPDGEDVINATTEQSVRETGVEIKDANGFPVQTRDYIVSEVVYSLSKKVDSRSVTITTLFATI